MGVEGGAYKEEFTHEELVALGEVEPAEEVKTEGTGTQEADTSVQETEKPTEEAAATETKIEPEALTEEEKENAAAKGLRLEEDKKGRKYLVDEDGSKIPVKRWKEHYAEAASIKQERDELKTKHDLFKQLGPEEYFKIYQDEAPQGWKPQERKTAPVPDGFKVLDLQVKGGNYEGYTLREVMQADPDEGTRLLNQWKDGQHAEIRKQEKAVAEDNQRRLSEAVEFETTMAKEIFNVGDTKSLTKEQGVKIVMLGQEVLNWQTKNNRLNLSFNEAYFLMKRNDLLKSAGEKGATNVLKGLQKQGPPSIDTGGGGNPQPSGFETVSRMTDKELERHIDSLDEKAYTKFFKDAPASIRAKHPGMPWE